MSTSSPIDPPTRPSSWRPLASIGVILLLALGSVILLAVLILDPPRQDLELLALFLAASGLTSVAVGYLGLRLGWRLRRGGLRLKVALAVAMGVVVALVNVAVTAYLMFLSPHDLALLSLLLLFALALSLAFGLVLSASLTSSLRTLALGASRMAEGDLAVRVEATDGDEVGDVARAFNAMADEVERAFQRQRELEQARRDLVGAVSHDLRTPLAALQAMVEALTDGVVSDPATVRRYLQTMRHEISSLSALIGDLFELSQLDAGVLRLQIEASPVQDLISDTLEGLRAQAERKGLSLTGEVDAALPPVLMDSAQVQRVLYNLVQNAIRHTPADGTVVLEVAGRRVGGAGERRRLRRGDQRGRAAARLRPLLQGRPRADPRARRGGPRPGDRPRHRGGPRREDLGGVGSPAGQQVHLHPAEGAREVRSTSP